MRVGTAEDAGIAAGLSQLDLSRPGHSPGRAEEHRFCGNAECCFGLLKIADEFRIGMTKRRNVAGIMIADLMSGSADCGHHIRVTQGAVSDEKESGFGAVALQDVQDLWRERRVRAIIEGKGNKRNARADTVDNVGREVFEGREQPKRLDPEHKKAKQPDGSDN